MPYVGGSTGGGTRRQSGGGGGGIFNEVTNSLGLGGVAHDVGMALHYASVPIKSVVPDAINIGEHLGPGIALTVEHPLRVAEGIIPQLAHDFTDPSMWYHHPLDLGLDLASVVPLPTAALARGLEIGRVLAGTSRLALPADEAAAAAAREAGIAPDQLGDAGIGPQAGDEISKTQAAARNETEGVTAPKAPLPAPTMGNQLRRAIMYGGPQKIRPIWDRPMVEDPETGEMRQVARGEQGSFVQPGMYFSRNPLNQWFQQQIDNFHELHPDLRLPGSGGRLPLRIPGVYKPQSARIGQAAKAVRGAEKGAGRIEMNKLLQYAKLPNKMHEAIRLVMNGVTPETKIDYLENRGGMEGLSGFNLKNAEDTLTRVKEVQDEGYVRPREQFTTEPTMEQVPGGVNHLDAELKTFNLPTEGPFLKQHLADNEGMNAQGRSVVMDHKQYDRMVADAERVARGEPKFVPSKEWQKVPEGTVLQNGAEIRMDANAGTTEARWDKPPPPRIKDAPTAAERTSARNVLRSLAKQVRPEEAKDVPYEGFETEAHPGGTYTNVSELNPEHPDYETLKSYLDQARLVDKLRTEGFRATGQLSRASEVLRNLGPKSIMEGHGIVPNLEELRRTIRLMENAPKKTEATEAKLASARAELNYWEHVRGEKQGEMPEPPEGMGPTPLTDPALADQLGRVPEMAHVPKGVDSFMRPWKGGRIPVPSSLTHQYQGIMERHGFGDPNTARVIASSYQEYVRFHYLTKLRSKVLASARSTPAGIPDQFRLPISEDYWKGKLPVGWNFPKQIMDEGADTATEAEGASRWYDSLRQLLTDPASAIDWANANFKESSSGLQWAQQHGIPFKTERDLERIPIDGIKWIDKRMLGGLDKPNPLWSAMENPIVRGALKGVDAINEIQKTMLLYLKPAYLLPNMMGNVALSLVHQGFLAPWHMARTLKIMFTGKGLTPETVAGIKGVMGGGLTGTLREGRTIFKRLSNASNKVAGGYGKVIDDPFRFSAFLHEADAAGFSTSAELHRLFTDPDLEGRLQEIGIRANDALIDYERLGPGEQNILRRMVFFYPWIKGSSRYAYQLAINHPTAASASELLSRKGEEWQQQVWPGGIPDFLQGAFPVHGGTQISNLASAAILQQPADIASLVLNTIKGNPNPDLTLASNFAPADAFMYTLGTGNTTTPVSAKESYLHRAFGEAFGGIPAVSFAQGLLNGFPQNQSNRLYPGDPFLTHLNQFVGAGGASNRNFNAARAAYDYFQSQHPTGYGR